MKLQHLWINLFVGFLTWSVSLSFVHRPRDKMPHIPSQRHYKPAAKHEVQKAAQDVAERLKTIRVICHPDLLEVVILADMFGIGAPVNPFELQLGVTDHDYCKATEYSSDEYRIIVGLMDCGTKHLMDDDSLVYTNLLVYSPEPSLDGLIRMEEAVIPIECHYERKYSVSSSSITPTWIPFMSTQAAVETLAFNLRIMTNDWVYERSTKVFRIGEPIVMEASVKQGHHMGLRVFMTSCVATLDPDIYSVPRYVFVEDGCLVDSEIPGSRAFFQTRVQDDKLQLVIDAFKFHDDDNGELYITCHLSAVPANDPDAQNKACTFVNGRWRSADGNDYLCSQCRRARDVGHTSGQSSNPSKFGPRGFGKPVESDNQLRSIPRGYTGGAIFLAGRQIVKMTEGWSKVFDSQFQTLVWEQEAMVGPVMVLPATARGRPIPEAEVPLVLHKISRPSLYGSQWRSGIKKIQPKKKPLESQTIPDQEEEQSSKSEVDVKEGDAEDEIDVIPAATMTAAAAAAALERNDTKDLDIIPPPQTALNLMVPLSETPEESELENAELTKNES